MLRLAMPFALGLIFTVAFSGCTQQGGASVPAGAGADADADASKTPESVNPKKGGNLRNADN